MDTPNNALTVGFVFSFLAVLIAAVIEVPAISLVGGLLLGNLIVRVSMAIQGA